MNRNGSVREGRKTPHRKAPFDDVASLAQGGFYPVASGIKGIFPVSQTAQNVAALPDVSLFFVVTNATILPIVTDDVFKAGGAA